MEEFKMKENKGFLLKTVKEMNIGACVSGAGFLLYLLASAVVPGIVPEMVAWVFGLFALYVWFSVMAGRREDKEAVSYNLLWGQSAVTLMLVACAVLSLKVRLGL